MYRLPSDGSPVRFRSLALDGSRYLFEEPPVFGPALGVSAPRAFLIPPSSKFSEYRSTSVAQPLDSRDGLASISAEMIQASSDSIRSRPVCVS
jgi:hypothetical protein